MTGPLAQLFMYLQRKNPGYAPGLDPRMEFPTLQSPSDYVSRAPMPFRDPMQAGPEPPTDKRILAALSEKKK